MSVNALGGPLVVLVLVAASVWFGKEIMNGVNRIYRPAVQAWMDKHNPALRAAAADHHLETCHKDDKEGGGPAGCRDPAGGPPLLNRERTCAEEMQERVRILTQTKGLTGPDPGGKFKAILKEEFVANMMAIQRKCQKQQQSLKCYSNLSPFSHIFIEDVHQCWCPSTTNNLVQTQCYYFSKESHVIS